MNRPRIVSSDEWTRARKELLAKEKELTRERDALSAERRRLPWVKVGKEYVFQGPEGRVALRDLFGGRRQLIVYHFMFDPAWEEGCKSCSYVVDNIQGGLAHLLARDVAYVVISRAPLAKLEAFKARMGWKFRWLSSFETDFNYDYGVSFRPEDRVDGNVEYNYTRQEFSSSEAPGLSVFIREGDDVFHTYSTYTRGLDILMGTYNYLDLTPLGRDEAELPYTMAWVRHHDRYETA